MKDILLSGGHYPDDKGAYYLGRSEYPTSIKWAQVINQYCVCAGLSSEVIPTGTLQEKVQYINEVGAKLTVEVHFNAATVIAYGAETLFHPKSRLGRKAAFTIHDSYHKFTSRNRGVKEGWHRMDRPGVVDYIKDVDGDERVNYFLRVTKMPAVVVEPCFLSEDRLFRPKSMDTICRAIALGIEKYVTTVSVS